MEEANIAFGAHGGMDEQNSYREALRKSAPQLIGYSAIAGDVKYDLDDHAWISSHWKSSPQRRKADMGDPMVVNADMAEVIASTAEGLFTRTDKTVPSLNVEPTMAAQETENLTIEFPSTSRTSTWINWKANQKWRLETW